MLTIELVVSSNFRVSSLRVFDRPELARDRKSAPR
jgi:hypothetical protein